MSESHALEAAKAHAKHLLALARAVDTTVIRELRKSLPRLAVLDDKEFAATVKLADVQHALAVRRGARSWAEFRRTLEHVDPLQVQAERFLAAVREEKRERAAELLQATPGIAQYSIHAAAAACDVESLTRFLALDNTLATLPAPPNKAEPIIYASGTPLQAESETMMARSARCVELLLDAGASPDSFIMFEGGDGTAPLSVLFFASSNNNVRATRLLLERGARTDDGESVYHTAERNHRECLQLLFDYGADINNPHAEWGNTPLYFLAGYKPHNRYFETSEQGMAWLLEHGANPNIPSHTAGRFATHVTRGECPLHRIASHGKGVNVAQMLLRHGAAVDTPRADGKTPYSLAIRTNNVAVAEFLASNGADTTRVEPLDELLGACLAADETRARAIVAQHPTIVQSMSLDDVRTIFIALDSHREDSVRLMASIGWNLSVEGEWGGTPLHQAAWSGLPSLTRLLLGFGAPVNIRDSTYGSSPIAWAAHGSTNSGQGDDARYTEVVKLLLDAGSTREESYNKWNEPPESMGSKAVVRVLRERGFAL